MFISPYFHPDYILLFNNILTEFRGRLISLQLHKTCSVNFFSLAANVVYDIRTFDGAYNLDHLPPVCLLLFFLMNL